MRRAGEDVDEDMRGGTTDRTNRRCRREYIEGKREVRHREGIDFSGGRGEAKKEREGRRGHEGVAQWEGEETGTGERMMRR